MKQSPRAFTSLIKTAACALLMLGTVAHAQDKKVDPTGTWTWTTPARGGNGGDRTNSVTLKYADSKLTGTMMQPGRGGNAGTEVPITAGKLDGDNISFEVVNDFNGNSRTNKYYGKISGSTITGKNEGGFGGGRRGGGGAGG